MDQFHANLLLLQSQRLSFPPQPFDCAIRLKGAEQKEHLLLGHSHILGAKCVHFRSQLDQSVPVPIQSLLAADGSLIGLAQTAAVQTQLHELRLDLSMLDNALESFKVFLAFLYGDQQPAVASGCGVSSSVAPVANPDSLLLLSKMFAVPELELAAQSALLSKFLLDKGILPPPPPPPPPPTSSSSAPLLDPFLVSSATLPLPSPVSSASSSSSSSQLTNNNENALPLYAAYLQLHSLIQRQQSLASSASSCALPHPTSVSSLLAGLSCAPSMDSQSSSSFGIDPICAAPVDSTAASSSSISSSVDFQDLQQIPRESGAGALQTQASSGDLLVPSNDKEGWCRNKKYIQIVKKGYRCLVCNKVYGRYNSVSYHVTIYHRNPPIRCEEEGCQFTTREARYIHFHKYYRHQIALPESIDLASRKCPLLGCKHVSKSPAMLDKHIHRHVADCLKEGVYVCSMGTVIGGGGEGRDGGGGQCQFRANAHELMYEHLLGVHSAAVATETAKDGGNAEGSSMRKGTRQPMGGSASAPATPPTPNNTRAFPCEECTFKGRTLVALEQHKVQKHQRGRTGTVPGPATMAVGVPQSQQFGPLHSLSLLSSVLSSSAGPFGSLPNSPLSPSSSSVAGGLFPSASPHSLLLNSSFSSAADQQQLLAQLLAAQQLASSLLAGSPPQGEQQQQSPGDPKLF